MPADVPGRMAMTSPLMVVAIGGNALIKDKQHQSVPDQMAALEETSHHLAALVEDGWRMVIGHGNGPQVGFILRRSELAAHELHEVPLDVCGADTQGAIGYELQQALGHDFARLGLDRQAVTVVTQVEVDLADPAFAAPSKPIGSFLDDETAARRQAQGATIVEDAGRGKRVVVASPRPTLIVELPAVRTLAAAGFVVITVGGGGIPVAKDAQGNLHGVAAVIDKDFASSLLASELGADLFVIATAVDRVALDFGKPAQRWLDRMTLGEAKQYLAEGSHFAAGSMAPKIEACIWYLERGGGEAIITDPPHLREAVRGTAGTHIVRE
jgi:carbamate kinase